MQRHVFFLIWALAVLDACRRTPPPPSTQANGRSVEQLIAGEYGTLELPFSRIVAGVSGKRIVPVDPDDPVTRSVLDAIESTIGGIIDEMNAPASPAKRLRRINEASRLFEDALLQRLPAIAGLRASIPVTAAGVPQRTGYPDLLITHLASGRQFYLDPKLYESTAERSSLRSFYFTPKRATSKVQHDACHLLLGISHDGNDGAWRFIGWKLVDLSGLKVRLKPEFQASNRDLYLSRTTIRSGDRSGERQP